MNIEQIIDQLSADKDFQNKIFRWLEYEPLAAKSVPLPDQLHPEIIKALKSI
jgi:hypothetical protein